MQIKVVIEPCEEGGYHVWVPALSGCHSQADTESEALEHIKEAILLYLEPDEEPVPPARAVEVAV